MPNIMRCLDKAGHVLRKILLMSSVLFLLNNISIAFDDFVPLSVNLEVIDEVEDSIDTSLINKIIYDQSGIVIWKPDVKNMRADMRCYAMLNKSNNQISVSLAGPDTSLNSYLSPAKDGLNVIDLLQLYKHTELYGLLKNISNDTGFKLMGKPKYYSTNLNDSIINWTICTNGKDCKKIVGVPIGIIIKDYLFIPNFTIYNLKPENNSVLSSEQVEFTWQTELPSSSVVTIWENENSTPVIVNGPNDVVYHSVRCNLSCGSSYRYDVTSSISNTSATASATEKGRRLKIGECGPIIVKPLDFSIKRDYNQICTLVIKNKGSNYYNVSLNVSNPYSDIIMGFLETGTANESIILGPFEEAERKLIVHAQDVTKERYNVTVNLTDLNRSRMVDAAPMIINIDFHPDFIIREIASDPQSLVKTIRIDNLGDTLTDLQVRSDPESQIYLHPRFNHIKLPSGQFLEFYAVPLFAESGESINGNITATSGNKSKSLPVNFTCRDGNHIYKAILNYPQLIIEKDDWYCTNRPDINMSFLVPSGFNASDMLNAKMEIDFILPSPKGQYLPHNVTISLNDRIVDRMVKVLPEGTYIYDLNRSDFNYALPEVGIPGDNTIKLNTEHLNPAHYVVNGKVTIKLCLKKLERWICAPSQDQAEQILWNIPGIDPVSESLNVSIINPPKGSNATVNKSLTLKALVNGSNMGVITPQNNLEVFAEIENESRVDLFDDGSHNDSARNDGIYGGEWNPTQSGRINISVSAMNCLDSGENDTWIWVNNSSLDLAVSEVDIVKSSVKPGKLEVNVIVSNLGEMDAKQFSVDLSIGGRKIVPKTELKYDLAPGMNKTISVPFDETGLCGKVVRACISDNPSDINRSNDCGKNNYCQACDIKEEPDLIISEIENKTSWIVGHIPINFTVENVGKKDFSGAFAVELQINGTNSNALPVMISGLEAGQSKNGTFKLDATNMSERTYIMSICINMNNTVEELDETNNCAGGYLKIEKVNPPENPVVIINNSGPEAYNYPFSVQMPVVGSDNLRFVDEQDRELYYWVEERSEAGPNATIWINATRVHTGKNFIRVFPSIIPSDHQNPKKVFSFFDDFQTLDRSQWIIPPLDPGSGINGSLIQEMDKVKLIKSSSSDVQKAFFQSRNTFSSGQGAIFRADLGTGQDWVAKALGFMQNDDPRAHPSLSWMADGKDVIYFSDTGMRTIENNYEPGYRIFEIRRQSSSIIFTMNGREYEATHTNSIGSSMPIVFSIESDIISGSSEMIVDWVAVRNCNNGNLKAVYTKATRG